MSTSYEDKIKEGRRAAEAGGFTATSPMARADRSPARRDENQPADRDGKGGDVKELASAVPLTEVDSIEIKRLLVGKVVIVTVGGAAVKLEAGAGANGRGWRRSSLARERSSDRPGGQGDPQPHDHGGSAGDNRRAAGDGPTSGG